MNINGLKTGGKRGMSAVALASETRREQGSGELSMPVHHVTLEEAKQRFAELMQLAEDGEEVKVNTGRKTITIAVHIEDRSEKQEIFRKQETLARWAEYEETGEEVDHSEVEEWLLSWGTEDKKPCPTPK